MAARIGGRATVTILATTDCAMATPRQVQVGCAWSQQGCTKDLLLPALRRNTPAPSRPRPATSSSQPENIKWQPHCATVEPFYEIPLTSIRCPVGSSAPMPVEHRPDVLVCSYHGRCRSAT